MVSLVRRAVVVVRLGHDEDVVAAAERVLEDGGGAKVDIRVVPMCLVGGRAIEIPLAQLADVRNLLVDSLLRRKFIQHEHLPMFRTTGPVLLTVVLDLSS